MTPVKETVEDRRGLAGDSGIEAPRTPQEAEDGGSERGGRRAGILLIVVGCVLIALAAGEASADTGSTGSDGAAEPRIAMTWDLP